MFKRFKSTRRASYLAGSSPTAADPTPVSSSTNIESEPLAQFGSASASSNVPLSSPAMSSSSVASTPMSTSSSAVMAAPISGYQYQPSFASRSANKVRRFTKRRGYLDVVVLEGNGLMRHDMLSKSDPYVTLRVKSKSWTKVVNPFKSLKSTKVINNNPNPVWNQSFRFRVKHADLDYLKIRVYDSDRGKDDLIGKQWIPLSTLFEGQPTHMIVPLVPASGGSIHLMLVARGFGLPGAAQMAAPSFLPASNVLPMAAPAPAFIEQPSSFIQQPATYAKPQFFETQATSLYSAQKGPIVTEQLVFPPEQIITESRRLSSVGSSPMMAASTPMAASTQIGAY